jgi:DNA-binding transcriptional ArsR family regulator
MTNCEDMTEPPHDPIDCEQEEHRIAPRFLAAGDPTGWFEELYAAGERGRIRMPFHRHGPHPPLVEWGERRNLVGTGRRAVVVGCGLGADAEYVASRGYQTTGFDISEAAVRIARRRHPGSSVAIVNLMVQYHATVDRAFAALADPTRRAVLERLGSGSATISELAQPFGMSLTGMKKHIRLLEEAELVTTEKVGRVRRCMLAPYAFEGISAWLQRLDRFAQVIERTKGDP